MLVLFHASIIHFAVAPCGRNIRLLCLLKLANYIYQAADKKSRALVLQLDLSAAFDSIDASMLVLCLRRSFGPVGATLE